VILNQVCSLLPVYFLSPMSFGKWSSFLVIIQAFFMLTTGWHSSLLLNKGMQEFKQRGRISYTLGNRVFLFSLLFLLMIIIMLFLWRMDFLNQLFLGFPIYYFFLYFFALVLIDFSSNILHPLGGDLLQSVINVVSAVVKLVLCLLLFVDIGSYIFVVFISSVVSFFVSFYFVKKRGILRIEFDIGSFYSQMRWCLWQCLGIFSIYLINWGDIYVLMYCHISYEDIGFYSLSYRLFMAFSPLFIPYNILSVREFLSYKDSAFFKNIWRHVFALCLLFNGIFFCFGLLLSYCVEHFHDYSSVASLFWMFFPVFFLYSYNNILSPILLNSEKYKELSLYNSVQAILNICFNILFVPVYGVIGAILGTVFSLLFKSIFVTKDFVYVINKKRLEGL
jgi:O-antigen/teichoic acid export membrane protein